jgi:thioredoxin-like negative regulator of GroEL
MSATLQRDEASGLAKSNPKKALDAARKVNEPWFRVQALAWVARFTDGDPVSIASEAAEAAAECDDDYKKSASRAWEIAALAERGCMSEARKRLSEVLRQAKDVMPSSSRSEALLLLMQAAFKIGREDAEKVYQALRTSCSADDHWRCKRAVRDGGKMITGELEPRPFFW